MVGPKDFHRWLINLKSITYKCVQGNPTKGDEEKWRYTNEELKLRDGDNAHKYRGMV